MSDLIEHNNKYGRGRLSVWCSDHKFVLNTVDFTKPCFFSKHFDLAQRKKKKSTNKKNVLINR